MKIDQEDALDICGYIADTHLEAAREAIMAGDADRLECQANEIKAWAEALIEIAVDGKRGVMDDESEVRAGDLREGRGTHHPRVRVLSINAVDGDAECILIRSGRRKTIRVVTLSKAYKLVQRNCGPAESPGHAFARASAGSNIR